ncbi:Ubiquitin-like-conjugating enzyme ATG10 [Verticillium longisporum]|nr:Ubiquitin-like-conjugating enzyme ATG10 [Verticillium longisporum]
MASSSDLKNFPNLTRDEFAEVCHHFDNRYVQATLGPLRRRWKMRVFSAFDITFGLGADCTTYIQIIRPLEATLDPDDLSSFLDGFSFGSQAKPESHALELDHAMMDAEESDEAAMPKKRAPPDSGHVVYEIHLHPTYQMPCLWLTLHGLPADEPPFNIDTVFRRLVPDQYKSALRGTGPIGGISCDHHPLTGVPSFYVHPCLLGDAMAGFECSKENYLMAWLGLVGGCVGLWVPKEMAEVARPSWDFP